jgi:hypothetical protein
MFHNYYLVNNLVNNLLNIFKFKFHQGLDKF